MDPVISYKKIYGQEKALTILKKAVAQKRIPHAMLFSGPSGTQKWETALAFLKHLKCNTFSPEGPCNTCRNCYLFDHSLHPDVKVLEPKGKSRQIPIDDVKALIWFVQLKAYIGKYKIGLVKEADRLNKEAGNALLKILEDPPKNTIFILVSANRDAILPTILSRCQEISFFSVGEKEVRRYIIDNDLQRFGSDDFLAMVSGGRVGLLSEESIAVFRNDREMVQKALQIALERDIWKVLEISEETVGMVQDFAAFVKEKIKEESREEEQHEREDDEKEMDAYIEGKIRERLDIFFNVFLLFLRDIYFSRLLPEKAVLKNRDHGDFIRKAAQRWSLEEIEKRMEILNEARMKISAYANQKLTLDNLYIGLTGITS